MNPNESEEYMSNAARVLDSLQKKGVSLWSDNGTLRYRAPKGVLTKVDVEVLKEARGQIIAILAGAPDPRIVQSTVKPRPIRDRAPLSFSQIAHWNLYGLDVKPAIRQIATAIRIAGPLEIKVLETSFHEIVRRHDALRTRIVVADRASLQRIDSIDDFKLELIDLRHILEKHRESEVKRLIDDLIMEPVDLAVGPLLAARLLRLGNREHVLIAALEHMVSDARSMSILIRDVFTAYTQLKNGCGIDLPDVPVQFADYCAFLRNEVVSKAEAQGLSWIERLRNCPRVRFPAETGPLHDHPSGWTTVPVLIGPELKSELIAWCGARSTTLVMGVFATYAALMMRWCNVSEIVVPFVTDGRPNSEFEDSIGYFASVIYPRFRLSADDGFNDVVKSVTREYCAALDCADHSFIDAQTPPPGFTKNSCFNWVPQSSRTEFLEFVNPEDSIMLSTVPFVNPMTKDLQRDTEPFILFFDTEGQIAGEVYFPRRLFLKGTMDRLVRNFIHFLTVLLREPERHVMDIPII